jgi:hypothetical protein
MESNNDAKKMAARDSGANAPQFMSYTKFVCRYGMCLAVTPVAMLPDIISYSYLPEELP